MFILGLLLMSAGLPFFIDGEIRLLTGPRGGLGVARPAQHQGMTGQSVARVVAFQPLTADALLFFNQLG
jgi:hypothetical protein